jgi:hypothetical protein
LQSNLLPTHTSGTIGNSTGASNLLTVVSTNDPTGANVTQITCSTPVTSDSSAILSGDLGQFVDGVSGQPNMRYLTYRGHVPSSQPVQVRAAATAASSGGGSVVLTLSQPLVSAPGANQNINNVITAGMQIQMMPSHKTGLVVGGNAFFLAMPQLPDEAPYATANKSDPDTGVSMRMYYGSIFGKNQRGMITDAIAGSLLLQPYSMRILFPISA